MGEAVLAAKKKADEEAAMVKSAAEKATAEVTAAENEGVVERKAEADKNDELSEEEAAPRRLSLGRMDSNEMLGSPIKANRKSSGIAGPEDVSKVKRKKEA